MSEMTDSEIKKLAALLGSTNAQQRSLGKQLQKLACLKSQMELINHMYPLTDEKFAVNFMWLLVMYPINDLQCQGEILTWGDIEAWIERNPDLMPKEERRGKFVVGRSYKVIHKRQVMDPLSRVAVPYLKLLTGAYSKATTQFNVFNFGKISKDSIIAVAEI